MIAPAGKASYYLKESEILKPVSPQSSLYLNYDDGIQCFINNQLVINAIEEYHSNKYWNRELDVYKYLKNGLNLITCRVSNGDGNKGKGGGNFDAELILNDKIIIARGDEKKCSSSPTWRYYGKEGSTLNPPKDLDGDLWYKTGYSDINWTIGYAPFGEGNNRKSCTKGILKKSPDDVWFRKWFDVINLETYDGDLNEPMVSSPLYPKPILIRLGENPQVDMSKVYITRQQRPVITGLVKYDSLVKIYIDGKYHGLAKTQGGEKSGTSNFYYYPDLEGKRHTYFAVAQNKITGVTSFPSKLITFEIR